MGRIAETGQVVALVDIPYAVQPGPYYIFMDTVDAEHGIGPRQNLFDSAVPVIVAARPFPLARMGRELLQLRIAPMGAHGDHCRCVHLLGPPGSMTPS